MRIITKILSLLAISMLFFALVSCSHAKRLKDPYHGMSAETLFERGETALAKKDYGGAVKYFEALDARYPFSKNAEQAQLDTIYAYYKDGDKANATIAADRYIRLYPRGKDVDYAYYIRGVANFEQSRSFLQRFLPTDKADRDIGSGRESFEDFKVVVERFPNSQYAADARQRLVYLRNLLAKHEYHVAKYYYRRGAYVAAANRANYLIKEYQRTPEVEKALKIIIAANEKMGLKESAQDAREVLEMNFGKNQNPNS